MARLQISTIALSAALSLLVVPVAAFALLLCASIGPAAAAIGPVTVIQGYYQQTSSTTSEDPPTAAPCDGNPGFNCYFVFSRVPTGKQLIVTQVSCNIIANGNNLYWAYLLSQLATGLRPLKYEHLVPTRLIPGAYAISNSTLELFNSQERPLINIGPAPLNGSCTIAGQIKNAP